MVGGDRRSPPRHKAKGGGGKGKGGGSNEGLTGGSNGSCKSGGVKPVEGGFEEFKFGSSLVDEKLKFSPDLTGNSQIGANSMVLYSDHGVHRDSLVHSESVGKLAVNGGNGGPKSWAMEVEALEDRNLTFLRVGNDQNMEKESCMDGSACSVEARSLCKSHIMAEYPSTMKDSDGCIQVAAHCIAANGCRGQGTGMECDGLTPNAAISHGAVCDSLDYVNHNMGGCNSENSGKNGDADNTGMQRTNSCTHGVCSLAPTGQYTVNAANAYVNAGFLGDGNSASLAPTGQPDVNAVKAYVKTGFKCNGNSANCGIAASNGQETARNMQNKQIKTIQNSPMVRTQAECATQVGANGLKLKTTAVSSLPYAEKAYVKIGLMGNENSAYCGIAASNGQETARNMQNKQIKSIQNSTMVPNRAECAKQVGDNGLRLKATAVSSLPYAHPPNAWKRTVHLKVNTMELGTITENGRSVSFDEAVYERNKGRLDNGLVGKLFGRKLPLHILDQELSRRWSHVGGFRTILIGGGCFLCVFETMEARDSILMGGPWQIMGQLIGMEKWSPEFNPELLTGFSSPVWVRLPKLPLLFWDNITIARIASMIGEPLWIDAQTIEWGRCEYARVCIRIDLSKSLPTGIWIQGKQAEFFQAVEYEGISLLCFHCGIIGHKAEVCQNMGMITSTRNAASIKKTKVGTNGGAMEGLNTSSILGDCSSADRLEGHTNLNCTNGLIQQETNTKDSAIFVDQEDVKKYGPWILVSRKRKPQPKNGMKNAPNMIGKSAIPQPIHQPDIILESQQEKIPMTEDNLDSNVHDSEVIPSAQQMTSAEVMSVLTKDASLASSSRKGKSRISKAHFEKELLQLGPIALKSRKRKKKVLDTSLKECLKGYTNKDDTKLSPNDGGDASSSCGE